MSRRVFVLSGRNYSGNSGGSAGVNYRLFLANMKYKCIECMYHLFLDRCFLYDDEPDIEINNNNNKAMRLKTKIKRNGVAFLLYSIKCDRKNKKVLLMYEKKFKFTNDDIFIFHDLQIAFAFVKQFRFSNTLIVYHQQGESYYEWKSLFGGRSKLVKKYYENIEKCVFSTVNDIGFPSKGAFISFNETACNDLLIKRKYQVFYNGVPEVNFDDRIKCQPQLVKEIHLLTVSVLNDAKGVERIPKLIHRIKSNLPNYKIVWTLVGDGINHDLLKEQLKKYNVSDNCNWITGKLPHDSIVELMKEANFYIMMHNFSIFDFTTIEAMSAGCIPILSNVPANLEVGIDDNIIIISEYTDIDIINEEYLINKFFIYSRKNVDIQKKYFNDFSFLESYSKYIQEYNDMGGNQSE